MENLGDGIKELFELMKIIKKNQIEGRHKLMEVNKTVCQKAEGIKQNRREKDE